jgi:prepilin-type N-terminal cleavage/methylation domain-containing protein
MSLPKHSPHIAAPAQAGEKSPRRAFTIVELLVVVAIIALLLGVILVGLQGASRSSKKAKELNNLRQYGTAWQMYGNHFKDSAIPGYIDHVQVGGFSVQDIWKVTYEYPDHTQVTPENAAPYTWRLVQYLDNSHELIHFYDNADDYSQQAMIQEADSIAYEPAFGYNAYYIGGWWTAADVNGTPTAQCMYTATDVVNDPTLRNQVLRSVAQVPSSLVVFCSSSELAPQQYKRFAPDIAGSHYVSPPIRDTTNYWQSGNLYLVGGPGGGSGQLAEAPDPYGVTVIEQTSAPIGRYNGSAAICLGDGSVTTDTPGNLADQRRWLYQADKRNYVHPP